MNKDLLQKQFDKLQETGMLFRSEISGDKLWELYMKGFGQDPIYLCPESSEHNCNNCHNFIRRYGNIVALDKDLNIMTLFDNCSDPEYKNSFDLMSAELKGAKIQRVFRETWDMLNKLPYERITKRNTKYQLGVASNVRVFTPEDVKKYGSVVKAGSTTTFEHLSMVVDSLYVDTTGASIESIEARYREDKNVFKRALDEIPVDTLLLVKDLINQGSLLDGTAHLHKIEAMIPIAQEYENVPKDKEDNWAWVQSYEFKYARFRNELIGVLCSDLAQGVELNKAVQDWNKRVDPANYMKATAPITKQMISEAKKFIEDNGYAESFTRRIATIDDIKASDILHINSGDGKINPVSVLDSLAPTAPTRHKKSEFDGVETVSIDKFMKDILPGCTSVEVYLQSKHAKNFVTLTTAENKDSKPIFKWPNNFSWTYTGGLAGKSQIKEAVKKAGGFVDAPFRFSIMWNEDGRSIVDLDAHAIEGGGGGHIYYGNFRSPSHTNFGGTLDVDMIRPTNVGVENIFWNDMSRVADGTYKFFIRNFDGGNCSGAKAEIAIGDSVFQYFVPGCDLRGQVDAQIAEVTIKDGDLSSIKQSKYLTSEDAVGIEIFGLKTGEFQKVNLICLSPNHWDSPVGNKHYFFMLDGAKSPESIRTFHNENLIPELLNHRKVMEVLGNTTKAESVKGQLSGLGFDSTVRDEVILRLKGSFKRLIKVTF